MGIVVIFKSALVATGKLEKRKMVGVKSRGCAGLGGSAGGYGRCGAR